jgi:hypothetical protein
VGEKNSSCHLGFGVFDHRQLTFGTKSWSTMAKNTQATTRVFFFFFLFSFFFVCLFSSLVEGTLEDFSLLSDFLGEKRLNSSSAFVFPLSNYSNNIKNLSYNLSFVFLASCLAMEKRKSSYSSGF